eukprot:XP_011666793.1 PREDICTED: uncharacterized protein LOC105439467 [Strongylocentrotus purpuratus]
MEMRELGGPSDCGPACAFWMTYGGNNGTIPSMQTVDQLMYSLFRITLVDEYDYDGMRQENVWMTYILLVTFLMISAILCINLLIAMLSNTFQKVYDNATRHLLSCSKTKNHP